MVVNMKNTTDILKIILIVASIVFVILILVAVLTYDPVKQEKKEANNKLNTDQMLALLKYAQYHLEDFDNLSQNILSEDNMIVFALDYIQVVEGYNNISNTGEHIVVNVSAIEQAVKNIFNKDIDYTRITFNVSDGKVFVPIYPVGTDAQIYKFRSREYNEVQDLYTVYIDCLEIGPSKYSELIEGSVTEYNMDDVIKSMKFIYKEIDGRRVLLAYDLEYNI